MKIKRLSAFLMAVVLAAASLSGCKASEDQVTKEDIKGGSTNQSAEKTGQNKAKGRYVEKSIELPEEAKSEKFISMIQNKEGFQELYFSGEDKENPVTVYKMQADGTFLREPVKWLNDIGKTTEISFVWDVKKGEDGNIYAIFTDNNYTFHLVKAVDGSTGELILEDVLSEKNSAGKKPVPGGFAVTEDGNVLLANMSSGTKAGLYQVTDGSILMEFEKGSSDTDWEYLFELRGKYAAMLSRERKGFIVYDITTGKMLEEIDISKNNLELGPIMINGDNDYFLANSKGLHHINSGGSIAETVIDGELNSMSRPSTQINSFMAGPDRDYYATLSGNNILEIVHYVYDPDILSVPETQLTVYGLNDSNTIRQAISRFQKENPDVQVVFNTAQTEEGSSASADSINVLNTELLGGGGADILVLDGLPIESYMEKGVLEDISDLVKPMISSGELMENVVKGYSDESGKVFAVPSRFTIPMLMGDQKEVEAMKSMNALQSYLDNNPEKSFLTEGSSTTVSFPRLTKLLLCINYQDLVGSQKKLNVDKLAEFLSIVQKTGEMIGATPATEINSSAYSTEDISKMRKYKDEQASLSAGDVLSLTKPHKVASDEINGIVDLVFPLALKNQYQRTMSDINGMFIPRGIIGINHAGKQKDLAREFIQMIYSEDVQNLDLNDGFPVNSKSLDYWSTQSNGTSYAVSDPDGGGHISGDYPSTEDLAEIVLTARTLTVPLNIDQVLMEMIVNESRPFFEGKIDAGKAARAIENKAATYLAE